MGFWKVLGGVAAGVGAIVALPVAGPIGAVTAAGAAIGAAAGGLAGAAASALDEEENKNAYRAGERATAAKYNKKVEKLCASLESAEKQLKNYTMDKKFKKNIENTPLVKLVLI